jgi:hypothetical protein
MSQSWTAYGKALIETIMGMEDSLGKMELVAIIIRDDGGSTPSSRPSHKFYTDREEPLQAGTVTYPTGHIVRNHSHNVTDHPGWRGQTKEVLFLRRGQMLVDLYDDQGNALRRVELRAGDVIVLLSGAHGFEATTCCELVEVKTGPYLEGDKSFF